MQTRLLPGSSEHIPAGEKACPRAHLTPWLTEQSVAALVIIPQNWSKLLCTSLPFPWPECAGANRERHKGDENVVIINTCPCESSEPWWLHQNESECPSFETVWAEPLFELLPLHSSWLYSDQMHNVNTEESLLLPSTSCANVKGCYEALWIKEIVPSCIQILSTRLFAISQTKFQNEDEKHLWFVHRFQRDKYLCRAAYEIRSSYTREIGSSSISAEKNPWKGLTYEAFHFLSVCWNSTDDFM